MDMSKSSWTEEGAALNLTAAQRAAAEAKLAELGLLGSDEEEGTDAPQRPSTPTASTPALPLAAAPSRTTSSGGDGADAACMDAPVAARTPDRQPQAQQQEQEGEGGVEALPGGWSSRTEEDSFFAQGAAQSHAEKGDQRQHNWWQAVRAVMRAVARSTMCFLQPSVRV